jgi:hypothetical protein
LALGLLGLLDSGRSLGSKATFFHKIGLKILLTFEGFEMALQKIKVYDKNGVEIRDEWLRKRTLVANRILRKQRKPELETNRRRNRKARLEEVKNKPYIKGLKWNLGAHLRKDICDKLATQDLYGLGPGCYPANAYPEIPHDNCHCWDSGIIDKDYFKNHTPSKEIIEAAKKDPKYSEFETWLDDFLAKGDSRNPKKERNSFWGKLFGKVFNR